MVNPWNEAQLLRSVKAYVIRCVISMKFAPFYPLFVVSKRLKCFGILVKNLADPNVTMVLRKAVGVYLRNLDQTSLRVQEIG